MKRNDFEDEDNQGSEIIEAKIVKTSSIDTALQEKAQITNALDLINRYYGGDILINHKLNDKLELSVVLRLKQAWALDATDGQACSFAGISVGTLNAWLAKHPDLAEERTRLKELPMLKARATIIAGLDDFDHAFKYAERKAPEEFKERKAMEHTVRPMGERLDELEQARNASVVQTQTITQVDDSNDDEQVF